MPKQKKEVINPYKEMQSVAEEVEQTLPYDEPQESEQQEPTQVKRDYLDDFNPQPTQQQKQFSQPLMFQDEGKENLIKELLRVDWERIEHIVRGHKPMTNEKGDEYFIKIEGHYLNEKGINSILHYLSFYLSKDIKLGRYSAEQAQILNQQFAKQFTDWFFDNIEEFGLDTPTKKKMSKMFVHSVIDLVDASYSCTIEGKTIELLLKQFQVLQQQPLYDNNYNPQMQNPQKSKTSIMQRIFG